MYRTYDIREKILLGLFFIAVFINFLGPIVDPDFPFHIKTGEYIYQHKEIPEDDPFSFYGEGIVTDRERVLLSQYWIAQVLFYKIYSLTGPIGIILLRASVFFAIVFLLWFATRKRGFYSSLIIAVLATIIFQATKTDRPQIFSFIFALILVLLLEKFREQPQSAMPLYFVPPLVLLWANMHGGFVFGIAIIVIYAFTEVLKFLVNKPHIIGSPLEKRGALIFFVIALSAILFSYVNPVTNGQIIITWESHMDTGIKKLYAENREYMSPMEDMASFFSPRNSNISFWLLLGFINIVVFLNILRTKSIDITVLSLLLFSTVAALTAVRYIPFFVTMSVFLSRNYGFFRDNKILNGLRTSYIVFLLFLLFFLLLIGFGLKDPKNLLAFGRPTHYPEGTAQFLLRANIGGKIFNLNNKGSYLLWKLYPRYKVFNDTRFISLEAVRDTDAISYALENYGDPWDLSLGSALSALVPQEWGTIDISMEESVRSSRKSKHLWKNLLDRYEIDLIVHEATADFTKELYTLTLRLLKDDEWVLIYRDGIMQIFIRNNKKYSKIIERYKLPKDSIYDEIIFETVPFVSKKVPISKPYSSLAFALMMKGKDEDARKMIEAAIALDKNDFVAHFCNAYLLLKQKNVEKPL